MQNADYHGYIVLSLSARITEAEEVPSTEAVLETESTEDAGDVIEGEVIIGTEEASGNDVVTNLSGGSSGTDVYTYIIYK